MNITEYKHSLPNQDRDREVLFFNRGTLIQKTVPLAPVQIAFRQLANDPLYNSIINKTNIAKGSSLPWAMARIEALFNAIYASGMTTYKDLEQIQILFKEIEKIQTSLKNTTYLSIKEKQLDKKCLKLAQQALTELADFPKALEQYEVTKKTFENALDFIVDRAYSPLYPGEALSSFSEISRVVEALLTVEKQIEQLPEKSSIRLCLQQNLDDHLYAFSFYFYDWQDEINEFIERDSKDLFQRYKTSPVQKKEEITRQLSALSTQQSHLSAQIDHLLKKLKTSEQSIASTLISSLNEAAENIKGSALNLKKALNRENIELTKLSPSPLEFGDEEWCALSAQRQEENRISEISSRTIFGNLINVLTDPENWSNQTKDIVYRLLAAMQIGEQAIGFSNKLNQAQYLKAQAEAASTKITPEMERKINRDNAYLGTLLSDKYQKFLSNPGLIEEFSKGNPLIHEGIQKALAYFGPDAPNRAQLFLYLDAFKSKQFAELSQSPFAHLSISEWIELFTQPEEKASEHSKTTTASQDSDQKAVVPRRAFELMGKQKEFPTIIQNEMKGLMEAKQSLQKEIKKYSEASASPISLNQQIDQLQNEINELESNVPSESSSLTELAAWIQSVNDLCFAITTGIRETLIAYHYFEFFAGINQKDSSRIKKLILNGDYPDVNNEIWKPAYHIAIKNGDKELVALLIKMGVPSTKIEFDTSFKKEFRNLTPLMYALFTGKYEISKLLLKNGAVPDYEMFSLFYHQNGDEELIQLLINAKGFDINKKNANGQTYLDQAIKHGELKLAKILSKNGALSNSKDLICNAVYFAISRSDIELIDLLIERNIINQTTLNLENSDGITPLVAAVKQLPLGMENIHILQTLLNAGADIDQVTSKKISPLSLAETYNNKEIYEFLLNAGAKPLRNAIHTAIKNNQPELIAPLLSSGNIDINEKDFSGFTALELAINANNFDLMKNLIEWGADLSVLGSENYPIFYNVIAVIIVMKDIPLLESLLNTYDLSLNYIIPPGATLLHMAAFRGQDEVLKILLSHGAKPDIIIQEFNSPLMYALRYPDNPYQNIFGTDDFTEVFLSLKLAAHTFELAGEMPLNNLSISLEAGYAKFFAKAMSSYLSLFEKQFSGLNENELTHLQNILEQSISRNRDPKIMFKEYQEGEGILIHTGFSENGRGHAVSCYIFDEYVIVGNKGSFSNRPLEIYKINKEKISEEFFKGTQLLSELPARFYKGWVDELAKELDGVSLPLTTAIEKAYPLNSVQLVGNCAWESTEATLFGIMALDRALEAGILDKEILKDTQKTYVEMTQFFQLESFENYLKKYLCEYHQLPNLLGDRDHYLRLKHSILQEIRYLPEIFAKKIDAIKALLVQVDQRFN